MASSAYYPPTSSRKKRVASDSPPPSSGTGFTGWIKGLIRPRAAKRPRTDEPEIEPSHILSGGTPLPAFPSAEKDKPSASFKGPEINWASGPHAHSLPPVGPHAQSLPSVPPPAAPPIPKPQIKKTQPPPPETRHPSRRWPAPPPRPEPERPIVPQVHFRQYPPTGPRYPQPGSHSTWRPYIPGPNIPYTPQPYPMYGSQVSQASRIKHSTRPPKSKKVVIPMPSIYKYQLGKTYKAWMAPPNYSLSTFEAFARDAQMFARGKPAPKEDAPPVVRPPGWVSPAQRCSEEIIELIFAYLHDIVQDTPLPCVPIKARDPWVGVLTNERLTNGEIKAYKTAIMRKSLYDYGKVCKSWWCGSQKGWNDVIIVGEKDAGRAIKRIDQWIPVVSTRHLCLTLQMTIPSILRLLRCYAHAVHRHLEKLKVVPILGLETGRPEPEAPKPATVPFPIRKLTILHSFEPEEMGDHHIRQIEQVLGMFAPVELEFEFFSGEKVIEKQSLDTVARALRWPWGYFGAKERFKVVVDQEDEMGMMNAPEGGKVTAFVENTVHKKKDDGLDEILKKMNRKLGEMKKDPANAMSVFEIDNTLDTKKKRAEAAEKERKAELLAAELEKARAGKAPEGKKGKSGSKAGPSVREGPERTEMTKLAGVSSAETKGDVQPKKLSKAEKKLGKNAKKRARFAESLEGGGAEPVVAPNAYHPLNSTDAHPFGSRAASTPPPHRSYAASKAPVSDWYAPAPPTFRGSEARDSFARQAGPSQPLKVAVGSSPSPTYLSQPSISRTSKRKRELEEGELESESESDAETFDGFDEFDDDDYECSLGGEDNDESGPNEDSMSVPNQCTEIKVDPWIVEPASFDPVKNPEDRITGYIYTLEQKYLHLAHPQLDVLPPDERARREIWAALFGENDDLQREFSVADKKWLQIFDRDRMPKGWIPPVGWKINNPNGTDILSRMLEVWLGCLQVLSIRGHWMNIYHQIKRTSKRGKLVEFHYHFVPLPAKTVSRATHRRRPHRSPNPPLGSLKSLDNILMWDFRERPEKWFRKMERKKAKDTGVPYDEPLPTRKLFWQAHVPYDLWMTQKDRRQFKGNGRGHPWGAKDHRVVQASIKKLLWEEGQKWDWPQCAADENWDNDRYFTEMINFVINRTTRTTKPTYNIYPERPLNLRQITKGEMVTSEWVSDHVTRSMAGMSVDISLWQAREERWWNEPEADADRLKWLENYLDTYLEVIGEEGRKSIMTKLRKKHGAYRLWRRCHWDLVHPNYPGVTIKVENKAD